MKLLGPFRKSSREPKVAMAAPLLNIDALQKKYVAAFAYTFLFGLFCYLEDFPEETDAFRLNPDSKFEKDLKSVLDNDPSILWLIETFQKGVHPREIFANNHKDRDQSFLHLIRAANLFAELLERYAFDDEEVKGRILIERPEPEALRLIGAYGGRFAELCVKHWRRVELKALEKSAVSAARSELTYST